MTPGARLAAAAEILGEILSRKAAADRVLLQWGKSHRFAGSKDRSAIAVRVYSVLRRLNECSAVMGSSIPRHLVLGSLKQVDRLDVEQIEFLCVDGTHALGGLSQQEKVTLTAHDIAKPDSVARNCPDWLYPMLFDAFGAQLDVELNALNQRAPLDLRVNLLKATRESVFAELVELGAQPRLCALAQTGIRFEPGTDLKLNSLACYLDGRVEVQDESSQLCVEFSAVNPGDMVVDLAAGAGGKSLGFAAQMQDRGHVLACDISRERLSGMRSRILRSSATNIELLGDPYDSRIEQRIPQGADLVFVDAPCSGSGTWRRNPESKWNLTQHTLQGYCEVQMKLLERAAVLVKNQGRLIYAVCSVLRCEGERQVDDFCNRFDHWKVVRCMSLTPLQSGTDGFFAAELKNAAI